MIGNSIVADARRIFHKSLLNEGILTVDRAGIPSNADKSSRLSVEISKIIASELMASVGDKIVGQTSGAKFEVFTMEFLRNTFPYMSTLRPGKWHIDKLGNRSAMKTSSFSQYEHLDYLNALTKADALLATTLGNDYMVAPDIVVYREPESDDVINAGALVVDDSVCSLTPLRAKNNSLPLLHASVSAKWTMRSDRAQNSRTEALGLIRNRKGHLPHIVVVTAEPMPSRLASLALGTGDIDCLYHFALYELVRAVGATGAEDAMETLNILIKGKRLKDISDLPIDLAI
ncbi:MAG: NgoMIV family type II restriction endonuclease [Muribaculaceae bacterium]|nr:NgoMIV family type II restriction endonuclease [Muribaculaceae bacterium]